MNTPVRAGCLAILASVSYRIPQLAIGCGQSLERARSGEDIQAQSFKVMVATPQCTPLALSLPVDAPAMAVGLGVQT